MPSAKMRKVPATTNEEVPVKAPESNQDVEGLVLELKENLRLTTNTLKSVSCLHLSKRSSRASPYRIPNKINSCDNNTCKKYKNQNDATDDDPYGLLQKLLREGGLVNEAVRRLQLGVPKRIYSYESDEESSPRWVSDQN